MSNPIVRVNINVESQGSVADACRSALSAYRILHDNYGGIHRKSSSWKVTVDGMPLSAIFNFSHLDIAEAVEAYYRLKGQTP